MKKLLLLSLVAALLLQSSCGEAASTADTATPDTSAPVTTADPAADNLPQLDFDGKSVTFLYREELLTDFYAESANGDVVNDALYQSFRDTEERLNVDIQVIGRPGHDSSVRNEYMNHISSTVMAGDSVYDWVDLMIGNSSVRMAEGIFCNLLNNTYIDTAKPYYLKGLADEMALDGKLYFIAGDASIDYLRCAYAIYFNKKLADDYKVENLYDLVDSGKWTLDKLKEIAAQTSADLDGDGKYTPDDQLGFCIHDQYHLPAFFFNTDTVFFTKSGDKLAYTYGTERDANIVAYIYDMLHLSDGIYQSMSTTGTQSTIAEYNKITEHFLSDKIFMMSAQLNDAVSLLRDMKSDYGILPFPKYDDTIDGYISGSRNTHNAFSLTITCEDTERAGAVLEALSSANHKNLLPAYYEVALKTKYTADDDSARMYDIIRDGMTLNFGYIYSNAVGDPTRPFMYGMTGQSEWASYLASVKPSVATSTETYLEKIKNNCQ